MRSKRTAGRVAALVGRRLGEIASRRSQKEVARLAGLSPTFLSMLKHGKSKLPIESAIALADALEVDRALLFRFALEEAQPRAAKMITATFGLATRNEMQILRLIREASSNTDPELTTEVEIALREVLGNHRRSWPSSTKRAHQ